jgi:hypothetical protein
LFLFKFKKKAEFKKFAESGDELCRVSQELSSLLRDLITELILGQKLHIHMCPIGNGSGDMSFEKF